MSEKLLVAEDTGSSGRCVSRVSGEGEGELEHRGDDRNLPYAQESQTNDPAHDIRKTDLDVLGV